MNPILKVASVVLVLYAICAGLLLPVPELPILGQTIRNLFYHVPMWFGMIFLLVAGVWNAINYLRKPDMNYDSKSEAYTQTAIFYGIMGLATGMIWAKKTWGTYWTSDPKLNSAAIGMLVYCAYLVLRNAIDDEEKRARVSAVYSVFSFPLFCVLIFVLPRLTDSLHPGNGGNPGFNSYDLDNSLRMVFYPAVIGWTLLGFWLASISVRLKKLNTSIS